MNGTPGPAPRLVDLRNKGLLAALAGTVVCLVGLWRDVESFLQAYLLGFVLWIGFPLGSLALLMIHNLTGGAWGRAVRPTLDAAVRSMPLFAVLVIPILLGMRHLYPWIRHDGPAHGAAAHPASWYLDSRFFVVRTLIYLSVWICLAFFVHYPRAQAEITDNTESRLAAGNGVGLVLLVLTVTLASVDWVMSLEPHWYSTIYGLSFAVGQALSAMAFSVLILGSLTNEKGPPSENRPLPLNDLGNLLLVFVLLWAYLAFSQYLIIWSANLPAETSWYVKRISAGWGVIPILLAVFHFAVPFLLLLSKPIKNRIQIIRFIALGLILFRWLDLLWITAPAFDRSPPGIHWLDVIVPATLGAVWLTGFAHTRHRQTVRSATNSRSFR